MEPVQSNANLITPETRIEITYHIDTRKGPLQLMSNHCLFEQGKAPCMGGVQVPCNQQFKTCNFRPACMDQVGRIEGRLGELPSWIETFTAKWLPETFHLRCIINEGAMRTRITGNKEVDLNRRTLMVVQYLLKEWDLDLELQFESPAMLKGFSRLTQETLDEIERLPGEFLEQFVERAIYEGRRHDPKVLKPSQKHISEGKV